MHGNGREAYVNLVIWKRLREDRTCGIVAGDLSVIQQFRGWGGIRFVWREDAGHNHNRGIYSFALHIVMHSDIADYPCTTIVQILNIARESPYLATGQREDMACDRGGNKGFTSGTASIRIRIRRSVATLAMQMPDLPGHKSDAHQEG